MEILMPKSTQSTITELVVQNLVSLVGVGEKKRKFSCHVTLHMLVSELNLPWSFFIMALQGCRHLQV
jgi:hypothetical protein